MNHEILTLSESGPRTILAIQSSFLVDESERNEFGEAPGFFLNVAKQQHVPHPVLRRFDVSIHQS